MVRKGKISLMLGLIAGTLTGLLFAPKRGSQLREKIIKERREGGLGHKAIADDLSEMVEEISSIVKDVAKSEPAKDFWAKTNKAFNDFTEGNIDLDQWVKEAHKKADLFKKTASKYVNERKKEAIEIGEKTKKKVKRVAKRVTSVKKVASRKVVSKKSSKRQV
ncbi:MAG: hypothetical protein UT55_C0003G0021 [Candidatus Peregrinibacteria bacterium GW2011_GWE2_39_6]|nr:MAG: hypothetical protein UT36_C0005G0090 [Candidatus Peregrinibacteria bacterium GW2011_GWF2_39_17]KKR26710.1 MAG: hypothetical protein UT55_C0003G0021 [Candidatus Peregrinibacteria bacterium GW2011_GWE2_39_6]HCW32925.1 hypothetical protein [Candidatus Peregrinibacteria bacterium]